MARKRGSVRRRLQPSRSSAASPIIRAKAAADIAASSIVNFLRSAEDYTRPHGLHFELFSVAYLSRLGLALGWLGACTFCNAVSSVLAGYRYPRIQVMRLDGAPLPGAQGHTLPDLGHDVISRVIELWTGCAPEEAYVHWFEGPDFMVWMHTFAMGALLFVHPRRLTIFRRWCIVLGWLMLLRSLCIIVTSIPDASPTCQDQLEPGRANGQYRRDGFRAEKVLRRAWKVWTGPGANITCGDMVFSGHTTVCMLVANMFSTYFHEEELPSLGQKMCKAVRGACWTMTLAAVMLIVGTRLHYTLDVVIAVYLASNTWAAHHRWARDPSQTGRWSLLAWLPDGFGTLCDAFMVWMEKDAGVRLMDEAHLGGLGGGSRVGSADSDAVLGEADRELDQEALDRARALAQELATLLGGDTVAMISAAQAARH
jgi:hypothetical protein